MNETEKALFSGLAKVKVFPMDPGRPIDPPSRMIPASNFLPGDGTTKPSLPPEGLGPVAQAMRNHPGLTRAEAEEMLAEHGF
jgi:hypothetical protein